MCWCRLRETQIKVLLVLFFVSIPLSLLADNELPLEKGVVLEGTQSLKVRSEPPKQKLYFFVGKPGPVIFEIKSGDKVTIEDVKIIKVPLRKDIWVKIKQQLPDGGSISGWVYYGTPKKSKNFKIQPGGQ